MLGNGTLEIVVYRLECAALVAVGNGGSQKFVGDIRSSHRVCGICGVIIVQVAYELGQMGWRFKVGDDNRCAGMGKPFLWIEEFAHARRLSIYIIMWKKDLDYDYFNVGRPKVNRQNSNS